MAEIATLGQIGGVDVLSATLTGPGGLRAVLLTYGARLAQLWVLDRSGALADIVLGHETLADWQTQGGYLGATCGRYSNRIADGRFVLDGQLVQVDQNEGAQHLHGGVQGFDRKIWDIDSHRDAQVTFVTTSPAGEMGYPGAVQAQVIYRLQGAGLEIEMTAQTDAPTVVNLVNHAYFNLAGQGSGDVLAQHLQVEAEFYLPVDDRLIPTGEVLSVTGTAFDFRTPRPIGAQMPGPGGFDHNLCLTAPLDAQGLRPCLEVVDPASGRQMRLATTEPGVQLYTGAHFDGTPGKAGARYPRFAGFAVETQRFPDSPNRPHFPSARLDPGQTYRHQMLFDFTPLVE
ncbi:MAG: galactose mutarotase [Rhodobacterales bacterium]|nr:MAG: galactose mutarotase [Rhodobacterales bacterium]